MRYVNPRLHRVATRLLSHEARGDPATSEALAAAAGRVLDRMSHRLGEILGPLGVQAILLRAMKLRKAEFAFIDDLVISVARGDSLAEPLRALLQEREPKVITEVAVSLVATFTGLVATVSGDRLTWTLLRQIWAEALLADEEADA